MGTNRLPAAEVPAAPESHEALARREIENVRALMLAEAKQTAAIERRKHLLELLSRERRMIRADIADRVDSHQRDMRKLTGRLEALNREIKEISPPRMQVE